MQKQITAEWEESKKRMTAKELHNVNADNEEIKIGKDVLYTSIINLNGDCKGERLRLEK